MSRRPPRSTRTYPPYPYTSLVRSFLALRQAREGEAAPGALDRQVLLFVPVFNVDGHERFGRWNRPNQRGPEEMGWRTTAQNYNLNRDYLKADAPAMQATPALVDAGSEEHTSELQSLMRHSSAVFCFTNKKIH